MAAGYPVPSFAAAEELKSSVAPSTASFPAPAHPVALSSSYLFPTDVPSLTQPPPDALRACRWTSFSSSLPIIPTHVSHACQLSDTLTAHVTAPSVPMSASSASFFAPRSFSVWSSNTASSQALAPLVAPTWNQSRRSSKSTSSTPSAAPTRSTSARRLRRRSFSNGDGAVLAGANPFLSNALSVISETNPSQTAWIPSITSLSEHSSPASSPTEYYSMPPPKRRSAPTSPMHSNTVTPSNALSLSLLALQLHSKTSQRSQSVGGAPSTFPSTSPTVPSRSPSSTFQPLEPGKRKQRSRSHTPEGADSPTAPVPVPSAPRNCLLNRSTVMLLDTFQLIQSSILRASSTKEPDEALSHFPNHHHNQSAPYYPVRLNETLQNGRYRVVSLLGRGSFGIVVRAAIIDGSALANSEVAIKILRKGASFLAQGKREWQVLQYIRKQQSPTDESQNFVVNAMDCFFQNDHFCIVFELLSDTLYELLQRSWAMASTSGPTARPGLSLRMVCKMAHQLLCALVTLRGLRIIHADLKPENVALTSPNRPRIKLLDFGSCCFASEEASNQFPYIQSRYYRAPEVLLGSGYGCEIDMWSLGCVVVELYLGKPLFIGDSTTQQLYKIIDVIQAPPESIFRRAAHWSRFFKKSSNSSVIGLPGFERTMAYESSMTDLRTLITSKQEPNQPQHVEYFVDFVERILRWDPSSRMTPLDALNHNFILHGPRGPAPHAVGQGQ